MTSFLLETPLSALLFVVFLLGAILAAAANYCVDRFAWTPRYRSPWRRFPVELDVPRRGFSTKIPIFGWLALSKFVAESVKTSVKKGETTRRFAAIPGWEGPYFWVRPFFVELLFAAFLCWRFSVVVGGADASEFGRSLVVFGAETFLFWIALCASLVDFDDYIIPVELVVPASVVGLILAAAFPFLTFVGVWWPLNGTGLTTSSVLVFAATILGYFGVEETEYNSRFLIIVGLTAIWTFWNVALLDRRWYGRLGIRRAAAIFWRRLRRAPSTPVLAVVWALGTAGIVALVALEPCSSSRGPVLVATNGLTNAMIGLFVGTALIWSVRLVGGGALGVEAMGFGDVVLMGAIGAFVGWQGAVVVFFIAPFFGLVFGIARRFVNTAPEIPYGPFLCLGTVVYVVARERFLGLFPSFYADPLFVAELGVFGLVLLAAMLSALRLFKRWAFGAK